jgi:hypothetical protein
MQRHLMLRSGFCALVVACAASCLAAAERAAASKPAPSQPVGPVWDVARLSQAPRVYAAEGFQAEGVQALFYQGEPYRD